MFEVFDVFECENSNHLYDKKITLTPTHSNTGTNANKPLGSGVIDKALAFARKSRNRLFRVHRDLELLKWNNKLEGMGVRQWYVVCSISMMLSLQHKKK